MTTMKTNEATRKSQALRHEDSHHRTMIKSILEGFSEDIAFYRLRTHQILVLFALSAVAIAAVAEQAQVTLLTRVGLVSLLALGARTVIEIFRTSTVRSKYVKLVRRTILRNAGTFLEAGMEITPITIDRDFDVKEQAKIQKSASSNTRQYERLAWLIACSLSLILVDPLLAEIWNQFPWR